MKEQGNTPLQTAVTSNQRETSVVPTGQFNFIPVEDMFEGHLFVVFIRIWKLFSLRLADFPLAVHASWRWLKLLGLPKIAVSLPEDVSQYR